jgi:hypothetical protein
MLALATSAMSLHTSIVTHLCVASFIPTLFLLWPIAVFTSLGDQGSAPAKNHTLPIVAVSAGLASVVTNFVSVIKVIDNSPEAEPLVIS